MEITRYDTKLAFTHEYMMYQSDEGVYVFYLDHLAAMQAKDEELRQEREARMMAERAAESMSVLLKKEPTKEGLDWADEKIRQRGIIGAEICSCFIPYLRQVLRRDFPPAQPIQLRFHFGDRLGCEWEPRF